MAMADFRRITGSCIKVLTHSTIVLTPALSSVESQNSASSSQVGGWGLFSADAASGQGCGERSPPQQ